MKLPYLSFFAFILLGCQQPGVISVCNLKNIQVKSDDTSQNTTYSAKNKMFNVQFRNENAPNATDNFPEPLVSITNLKSGEVCEITDANGIWSGKAVYIDSANKALLLNEYSGSTDTLIIYDMTTCKRLDEIDVSGRRWEVAANHIRIGHECAGDNVNSCKRCSEIELNNQCRISH